MNNKIIIGVVALAVVGGGLYFFAGNNSSSILPMNKKGELTRPLATQILWDFYNKMEHKPDTTSFTYNDYAKGYIYTVSYSEDQLKQLITKGLVKKVGQYSFDFTDAAAPYVTAGKQPNEKVVKLGNSQVKNITVTGIAMQGDTKAIVNVDIEGERTFTPFGEVLSTNNEPDKQSGQFPFSLYDDGWRVDWGGLLGQ